LQTTHRYCKYFVNYICI